MAYSVGRSSGLFLLWTACCSVLINPVHAQATCKSALKPEYPAPILAQGYKAQLVADGFSYPRGIMFDSEGALLVVDSGKGIVALTLEADENDCISVSNKKTIVDDKELNHGIEMSPDGDTLYASSSDEVFSWDYSASNQRTTSDPVTLVTKMSNSDHTTRTLLLSRQVPGLLVVSRGSDSNVDKESNDITSGHAQVKAFNLNNVTSDPYKFDSDGLLLAWVRLEPAECAAS